MMEYWKNKFFVSHSIIPLFHYSILFYLLNLCALCASVVKNAFE